MAMLPFLLGAFALKVSNCGSQAAFRFSELSLYPTNVVPGDPVTLHVKYTVPDGMVVTGGKATYAIKYNFIPLAPTVESLCNDLPCPLTAGTYSNNTVTIWPSGLSGSVSTKITWTDENDTLLACISMDGKGA